MSDTTIQQIPKATDEDKHVQKVVEANGIKYRLTPKYMHWEKAYLDRSNKDCYLNATRSAIEAYNLDPISQYDVASRIGFENVSKHKNLAGKYYRSQGKSEKDIWDIYWQMMLAKKDVNMLYSIAQTMQTPLPEYKPLDKPQYVIQQTNNQLNVAGDMSLSFIKDDEQQPKDAVEGEIIDAKD